jgi:hypothetical protein
MVNRSSPWSPRSFAFVAAGLLLAGCERPADYSDLELVEVTGKITLDGQSLAGVTVRFEGPPNRFADGLTDTEGKYRLMYDSNQAGCTPGEKVVRILPGVVGEGGEEGSVLEGPDGQVTAAPASIPAEFNSASKLTASVSASQKTFNFDLKSQP